MPPLCSGLARRPLKAVAPVRIRSGVLPRPGPARPGLVFISRQRTLGFRRAVGHPPNRVGQRWISHRARRPTGQRPCPIPARDSSVGAAAHLRRGPSAHRSRLESHVRVRVGSGVASCRRDREPVQVGVPALAVMVHGLEVGEPMVGEPDEGSVGGGLEGDLDGGRARWDDGVVLPSPGEDQAMWRVELDELAPRLDPRRSAPRAAPTCSSATVTSRTAAS